MTPNWLIMSAKWSHITPKYPIWSKNGPMTPHKSKILLQNVPYDSKIVPYDPKSVPYDTQKDPYIPKMFPYNSKLVSYNSKMVHFDPKIIPYHFQMVPFNPKMGERESERTLPSLELL